ncbi:hypothetical protein HDU77_001532 [Chytriomyces hyalinus]|nr:hypothetical protein HDU77_001532 [Chytriomyces hyalinus]
MHSNIAASSNVMRMETDMDCVAMPWTPGCESFQLPTANITATIDRLCGMMDWMPGCSIDTLCKHTPESTFCNPFSVLADICAEDMPRMKPCGPYVSMCMNPESRVTQCKAHPPLKNVPTTKVVKSLVSDICNEMPMDGCELCYPPSSDTRSSAVKQCDYFSVYAGLCAAMPEMHQCAQFDLMCAATPSFPLCPTSHLPPIDGRPMPPPTMQMYFHFSVSEYFLFKSFVPRTPLQYTLACTLVFLVCIVFERMLAFQRVWDRAAVIRYRALARASKALVRANTVSNSRSSSVTIGAVLNRVATSNDVERDPLIQVPAPARTGRRGDVGALRMEMLRLRLLKAAGRLCIGVMGYGVMLLVMTYNVGVCLSVLSGLGVGSFFFFFDEGVEVADGLLSEEEEEQVCSEGDDLCCG